MKDFLKLLIIGGSLGIAFQAILLLVALAITYFLSLFTEIGLFPETIVTWVILRAILGLGDLGFNSKEEGICPVCKKPVKSSLSAKCVECGGLVKLETQ